MNSSGVYCISKRCVNNCWEQVKAMDALGLGLADLAGVKEIL